MVAIIPNKRSIMTLYSGVDDLHSHRTRIVLAEKGVAVDIVPVIDSIPEDLLELNPYGCAPALVDRDLVLYESRIIMEYLDERFPHPPLLPVYPVARAKARLTMYRIDRDWYPLVDAIYRDSGQALEKAKRQLVESLLAALPIFSNSKYFLSTEFSLLDCYMAPLLWRLPALGIKLPPTKNKIVEGYAKRIFLRDSFQVSLTDSERELRGRG